MVDTHAHLDDPRLSKELDAVLARAIDAGVVQVVAIGTTADSSREVVRLSGSRRGVFSAVGIQPNHVAEARPGDWEQVVSLVGEPGVVAVGETGLDRYWDHTPFPQQQEEFDRHLALAADRGLPVVIHCRQCEEEIIAQLERLGRPISGVLHSFTGTWDDAQAFLALGLHLSIAGMITFRNPTLDPLRQVAARIPLDRLLVETDSPYLSPHPFRGKTNEPSRVAVTCARIAELRGLEFETLAEATTRNARGLFRLDAEEVLNRGTPARD
ncbi:TatD family deoxyribonuclease [Tautonia sociabilis]|uniref:TatD family deoxyribonuclease n=1 Tax=Tautonia sociabilis TaxID=2080755 RepID=A0A432MIA8_9BACT|nr:TatD family deoxyribonuclease [Tautonia sociabilis]